jgi:copper chaperone NosL
MTTTISIKSKVLLVLSTIALVTSIFVPLWRIELDAPQYPEGLMMQIYTNKLGGQVDIINGLNHYIGMQTLHAENFIEFTILPYIISAYALLILVAAFVARKKLLYFSFWAFVAFGVIAMIDFWRWEYNYGHNLDPSAAIIVPGMSYQPPLIGFKQLLNFGAYSVPDIGGWLFIAAGLFMLIAVLIESNLLNKFFKKNNASRIVRILMISFSFAACNNSSSQPIKLNVDNCDYCAMTIADGRFGAELITEKGRCYKFDDLECLLNYKKEKTGVAFKSFYVNAYIEKNQLIDASKAFYVQSESLRSPMGGNYAAFLNQEKAIDFAKKQSALVQTWNEILE